MMNRTSVRLVVLLLAAAVVVFFLRSGDEPSQADATESSHALRDDGAQAVGDEAAVAVLASGAKALLELQQAEAALLQATFPERHTALCGPSKAGDFGTQERANGTVMGLDGRTALVAGSASGKLYVQGAGQWLHWSDGTCRWEDPQMAQLSGVVEGGGEHLIAGCPGIAGVRTDGEGNFSISAPVGTMCFLRAHPVDGVGYGRAKGVSINAAGKSGIVLEPLGELEDASTVVVAVQQMVGDMLGAYKTEQKRLASLDADATWSPYRAHVDKQVARLKQDLKDLRDPEQMPTLVNDFLMGETW